MGRVFGFLVFFLLYFSAFSQDVHRVVVDFRSGDIREFEGFLLKGLSSNIQHYRDRLEELKVVVVIHGNGYKFFIKNLQKSPYSDEELMKRQKEFKERLENLVKFYGVRFEICSLGLKARGISEDNIYDFVKSVYSALESLVNWQNRGYAYILLQ